MQHQSPVSSFSLSVSQSNTFHQFPYHTVMSTSPVSQPDPTSQCFFCIFICILSVNYSTLGKASSYMSLCRYTQMTYIVTHILSVSQLVSRAVNRYNFTGCYGYLQQLLVFFLDIIINCYTHLRYYFTKSLDYI